MSFQYKHNTVLIDLMEKDIADCIGGKMEA